MTPLPCPFCANPHPRWRVEAIVLPDDGAIVCGDMSCGAQVAAMNEAEGWRRWNTRTSEEPPQWTCECGYMNVGPICTHCGLRSFVGEATRRVPDGARMARCSICKQEFPADYLSAGVCASCTSSGVGSRRRSIDTQRTVGERP